MCKPITKRSIKMLKKIAAISCAVILCASPIIPSKIIEHSNIAIVNAAEGEKSYTDKYNVTYSFKVDVSDLSKEDIRNINTLISKFIFNKTIEFTDLRPPRFAKMDIANISILFFVDKDQDDNIRLTPAYDLNMFVFTTDVENDERQIVVPPYVGYDAEIFRDVCNINYSDFLPSFKEKRTAENRFYQSMNWTILRMLMGFDAQIKKNNVLLETAFDMAKWLEKNDPDKSSHFIHVINCFQIKKRLNTFNKEDEECLVNILEMKDNNDELKFAAYLLLDDIAMAKRYFLNSEKQ